MSYQQVSQNEGTLAAMTVAHPEAMTHDSNADPLVPEKVSSMIPDSMITAPPRIAQTPTMDEGLVPPDSPTTSSGGIRQARRPRGSLGGTGPNNTPIVRRYSSTDLSTDEVVSLAIDLFDLWDIEHRGYLFASEVTLAKNLDKKFVEAIVRVLAFNSNTIFKENVIECVSVLKNGDLSSKVKLLVQFMDADGNQSISFEELKEYLRVSDDAMLRKLGLKKRDDASDGDASILTYEDILSIFRESDRGLEAISIFCEQILRILTAAVQSHGPGTTFVRRNSIVGHSGPLIPEGPSLCTQVIDTAKSFYSKLVHRIQTLSHAEVFKLWLIALQIALWLTYFFYHKNLGYPLAFCFAKGFGLNLRILTILMYLTMARTTMGQLYSIRLLRPFIPLGVNIEVHSFLGFSVAVHMFGHTFGHIAYQTMYTSGFQNAFTQNSLLKGSNWEKKLKGDGKTGFLLLFFVLLMGGTALFRSLSAKYYQLFALIHYAYLLYLPMIFLHVPHLWPYFVAIGAIMIIERLYDLKQNTLYTTLGHSRPCNNGITYLSVPRYGMMTYPGSYYRIKIPALSFYEWHPFSLAGSTSSHHLSFFIASTGDWTRALHQLVKDPERRGQTLVQVQGPFLAPASQALIRKPGAKILCVASGIGITPFFSVMATKVTDEVNFENDRMLYKQLFQETSQRSHHRALHHHDPSQNSLIHVLMLTQAQKQQRPSNASSKTTAAIINETTVMQDLEAGRVGTSEKEPNNNGAAQDDSDSDDEDDSVLKVVWSIRDVKELLFYLDYVHHLVKSQDLLHHDEEGLQSGFGDEKQGDNTGFGETEKVPIRRQLSNRNRRKRVVVEVEVYLTGLGNKSDPVYMLSQTLFLLSIANQSSSYMKIHFGRPDLEKIVKTFSPEEVYYCGGSALKDKLHDVCCQERIPFHPEDFDAGGGAAIKAYKSVTTNVRGLLSCDSAQEDEKGGNERGTRAERK